MALTTTLLLAVLVNLLRQTHDHLVSVTKAQWINLRDVFLHWDMTQLWQDTEPIRSLEEDPFLSKLHHWLVWTAAAVLLTELYWLAWQRHLASRSCHEQNSSSHEEEDDNEKEKNLKRPRHSVRLFSVPNLLPMQELSDMCKDVKKLVRDLLRVCRVLCKNTYMPEMHPSTGKDYTHESWSVFEDKILYQLLVFLQPPPRHSFKLELYSAMHLPERCSNIRVLLECTCSKMMMGDMLCFLHPSDNNQMAQCSPLLSTLCTGSYLDVEEIACWVQNLVQSAWEYLPQWHDWQLMVLPSAHSCRVLLTGPSEVQLCAVLVFAVQQGSPGTYLVLQ